MIHEVVRRRLTELVAGWRRAEELARDSAEDAKRGFHRELVQIYDNRAFVYRHCADQLERILEDRSLESTEVIPRLGPWGKDCDP